MSWQATIAASSSRAGFWLETLGTLRVPVEVLHLWARLDGVRAIPDFTSGTDSI